MSSSLAKAHIIVSGVVQGVGFRFFTINRARHFQLTGYVKNRPDGTVEVEAEGERGILSDFINELKVGPASAHVSGVKVTWKEYTGTYQSFSLDYSY